MGATYHSVSATWAQLRAAGVLPTDRPMRIEDVDTVDVTRDGRVTYQHPTTFGEVDVLDDFRAKRRAYWYYAGAQRIPGAAFDPEREGDLMHAFERGWLDADAKADRDVARALDDAHADFMGSLTQAARVQWRTHQENPMPDDTPTIADF